MKRCGSLEKGVGGPESSDRVRGWRHSEYRVDVGRAVSRDLCVRAPSHLQAGPGLLADVAHQKLECVAEMYLIWYLHLDDMMSDALRMVETEPCRSFKWVEGLILRYTGRSGRMHSSVDGVRTGAL